MRYSCLCLYQLSSIHLYGWIILWGMTVSPVSRSSFYAMVTVVVATFDRTCSTPRFNCVKQKMFRIIYRNMWTEAAAIRFTLFVRMQNITTLNTVQAILRILKLWYMFLAVYRWFETVCGTRKLVLWIQLVKSNLKARFVISLSVLMVRHDDNCYFSNLIVFRD